jgi:WD40 repeat protein
MWEIASGNEVWRQEAEFLGAMSLAVSTDGSLAAWGGYSHGIVVWDLDRGESKFEMFTTASTVSQLNFSPDRSLLAAVETDREKSVRLYDMQHGTLVRRISMEDQPVP